MDKPRLVHSVGGRESLSVVCVVFLMVLHVCMGVVSAQTDQGDRAQIAKATVNSYMKSGQSLYDQGNYALSEEILLRAQDYQQYLSNSQQNKLTKLLNKAHKAVMARESALQNLKRGRDLSLQGKTAQSRVYLRKIKGNAYLTDVERQEVATLLGPEEASKKSRSFFGISLPFMKKRANSEPVEPAAPVVVAEANEAPAMGSSTLLTHFDNMVADENTTETSVSGQGTYLDQVKKQRAIIRGHVKAVINETQDKVNQAKQSGDFQAAKDAIDSARYQVESNQIHLGKERVEIYRRQLDQMAADLALAQKNADWVKQQASTREALALEQQQQAERDVENSRTVVELLARAKLYKSQKKYEAAITQLDKLLKINPDHYEAKLLRSEVEDLILLKRSRDLDTDSETERVKTLLNNKEAMIPVSDEVTYPEDWRDIIAKPTRKPDRPVELEPANLAVYQQLESIVDLSDLSPEMAAGDAFDLLRNSVDPPLHIVVLWKDLLDNADIDTQTPIDMDPINNVTLGTALESLCQALSGAFAEIGYVVDSGVVKVGTVDLLPKKMETRIYDISDLATAENRMMTDSMNYIIPQLGISMAGSMMQQAGSYASQYQFSSGSSGSTGTNGTTNNNNNNNTNTNTNTNSLGGGMGMMGGGMGMMGGGMGMMGGGMGMMGGGMGMMGGGMGMMGGGMGMMGGGMGMMGGGMGTMGGGGTGVGGNRGGRGGLTGMSQVATMIENSIAPDTWYDTSDFGEGTIMPYPSFQPKKLAITQTREVHKQIESLLKELRKSLGPQVSIEARFLTVSKNFLEDIGLDADMIFNLGGKWGYTSLAQNSVTGAAPFSTDVPGSLGQLAHAADFSGQYGTILDDLQVSYLLRATQGRTDTKSLDAPRATVMSSDTTAFNLANSTTFWLPPTQTQTITGTNLGQTANTASVQPSSQNVVTGNTLLVTPTIAKDKKNVLLTINMVRSKITGIKTQESVYPNTTTGDLTTATYYTPDIERVELSTRVSVPDQGTLLLGGQRVTEEVEKEVGVPILSKLPIIGRAFRNNSTVKDEQVLLLLVKPTILLPDEQEHDNIAKMESAESHAY